MKSTAFISLLATLVTAQEIQSPPFSLLLKSDNATYNDKYCGACHCGAAIECMCIGSEPVTMHLNTSNANDNAGILTWTLPINPPVDSGMRFSTNPASNVAQCVFYPGPYNAQYVSFDKDDSLVVQSYYDDTRDPGNATDVRDLDRWFVCEGYYTGYRYPTLSWVYGVAEPQNPTCVKVQPKRVFL